jgi:hypothetical protein
MRHSDGDNSIGAIGAVKSAKFDWGAAPLPVEASERAPEQCHRRRIPVGLKCLPQEEYQGCRKWEFFS